MNALAHTDNATPDHTVHSICKVTGLIHLNGSLKGLVLDKRDGEPVIWGRAPFTCKAGSAMPADQAQDFIAAIGEVATRHIGGSGCVRLAMTTEQFIEPLVAANQGKVQPIRSAAGTHPVVGAYIRFDAPRAG